MTTVTGKVVLFRMGIKKNLRISMDRETIQELENENRLSNMYLLRGRVRRVQSLAVLM